MFSNASSMADLLSATPLLLRSRGLVVPSIAILKHINIPFDRLTETTFKTSRQHSPGGLLSRFLAFTSIHVDCVHCETNEFRTDPNSKWYSHKHNGAGVSYEVVDDICRDKILWTAGPKPASTHDITFFRDGTQVSTNRLKNEAIWDKNALYFQIPEGKKLIGDSGYKGGPSKISTSVVEHSDKVKEFLAQAKSRQETINTLG